MTSPRNALARPVRVLHVITGLQVGGAERMFTRLLPMLDPKRVTAAGICLGPLTPLAAELREKNVPIDAVGMSRAMELPSAVLRVVLRCREFRPDVLQGWMYHGDLVAAVAGRLARVPRVAWNIRNVEHRAEPTVASRALMRVLRMASRTVDVAVANSERGRSHHLTLGYRCRRWVVIPNGIDTDVFRPQMDARPRVRAELRLGDADLAIGMIGRLDPLKDHGTFLAAAARLAADRPNVRFVLVGRDVPSLRAQVAERGLVEVIRLFDERSDVVDVLNALDIGALTSRSEGFPNALLEAMACGLPCVTTDVGEAPQMLGRPELVLPVGDSAGIARAWRELVDRPDARAALGAANRARVAERYSLGTVAREYEALYESVTG